MFERFFSFRLALEKPKTCHIQKEVLLWGLFQAAETKKLAENFT